MLPQIIYFFLRVPPFPDEPPGLVDALGEGDATAVAVGTGLGDVGGVPAVETGCDVAVAVTGGADEEVAGALL